MEADKINSLIEYIEEFSVYNRSEFIELEPDEREFIVSLLKAYKEGKVN